MGGERDLDTVALIGHHDAAASIECYAHGAIELGLCRLRRVRHTDAASYLCVCVCVCACVCVCIVFRVYQSYVCSATCFCAYVPSLVHARAHVEFLNLNQSFMNAWA